MEDGADKSNRDDQSNRSKSQSENESSGGNHSYGDEEPEDEQEMIEAEMARQKSLDAYVEEIAGQIVNSNISEEQQELLVKIMLKQHTYMRDQLKMNLEDAAARDEGSEEYEQFSRAMYCFEERIEEYAETMERVQKSYLLKKARSKEIKNDID